MNVRTGKQLLVLSAVCFSTFAFAAGPTPTQGYKVNVFAQGVTGKYTAPDSIVVTHNRVYVGYANSGNPDGSGGAMSTIVEYTKTGEVTRRWTLAGHNDGLKINSETHQLWAMQNEDGNPNLVIIATNTPGGGQTKYTFGPTLHGGGYDDIVFRNGEVYFSASNPARNPNNGPAIVKATFKGSTIEVTPFLAGNGTASDILAPGTVQLNLQDPDSMTLDTRGDIVLDSQADSELIVVRKANTTQQSAIRVPLSSPLGTPQIDDTLFTPNSDGFLLVADTPADTIYAISKNEFAPGVAYSAAVAGTQGFVGRLDLDSGFITPAVTGLQSPHGLGFVKASDTDDYDSWGAVEGYCDILTAN